MTEAFAVIGAAYGDEGKGLVTDALCRVPGDVLVARFNGGAQAAHTVVLPNGQSHVFHHFGSGTLAGAYTYLSSHFLVNPCVWWDEFQELDRMYVGGNLRMRVSRTAPVTTPYDMLINREVERLRGHARHGSCGLGINETVDRSSHPEFLLQAADLWNTRVARAMLEKIRDEYVPRRLVALGISREVLSPGSQFTKHVASQTLLDNFLRACGRFADYNVLCDDSVIGHHRWDRVVFEGAQGLLLDEKHGTFPHVTRSRTGLANVIGLVEGAELDRFSVLYIMRAYMTRHGAGPFATECDTRYNDPTNVENPYQGALRFGHLDLGLIARAIAQDLNSSILPGGTRHGLVVTCLDQVMKVSNPLIQVHTDEGPKVLTERQLLGIQICGEGVRMASYGRTHQDIHDLEGVAIA